MNHDKKWLKALSDKRKQLSKNKQLWQGGGRTWSMGLCALALSACTSMAPPLPPVQADIPPAWPLASTTLTTAAQATAPAPEPTAGMVDKLHWRSVFTQPPLVAVIEQALAHNRDQRVALLNVEKARAQYRVARAGLWPQINASASTTRSGDAPATTPSYSLALGLAAFEIDLWGRLRSLSDSAQALVLAQEQAQRSTTLTLVAEVANAWWSLAADQQLLHITHSTLASRAHSLALTEARYQHGAASALEVAQQRSQWQQVRADAAALQGQIEQDMNALQLLVGRPLQKQWLPAPPGAAHEPADAHAWGLDLPPLPPGLPAQVLWQRPDIQQAEHQLRAANANIGAARAAFFPTISLTSSLGSASNELSAVLGSGTRTWSFIPNISLPLFDAGRLQGQLEQRQAERDIALANYEKAIQTGFQEVADALALEAAWREQWQAQQALLASAAQAEQLAWARYQAGRDSQITWLDAQRTLYSARQTALAAQRGLQSNRITLYKVLGGAISLERQDEPQRASD